MSGKSNYKLLVIMALGLGAGASAHGKSDHVAAMIAKSRTEGSAAPAAAGASAATDDAAELRDFLGETKLVGKDESGSVSEPAEVAAEAAFAGDVVDVGGANSESAGDAAASAESTVKAAQMKDITKLKETEIPVLTESKKVTRGDNSVVQRALIGLGVLLAALVALTYGLKRWTRKTVERNKGTKIKVLTQHFIGPKKSVAIIQVAGESILVGVTDQAITMLKTLSLLDEEIPVDTPASFDRAMDEYDEQPPTERRAPRGRPSVGREADDFAMGALAEIRDTVSRRLKGLKEI